MFKYMLDTDTVSYALRREGNVASRILGYSPSQLCISAITLAEMRIGAHRRKSRKLHAAVDVFVSKVSVAPFDDKAANNFGIVGASLLTQGKPIGHFDTMIASHALSLGLILVTNNTRHYSCVSGLCLENWL